MELKCVSLCRTEHLPLLRGGAEAFTRRTGQEIIWAGYTEPAGFLRSVRKQWSLAVVFWPGNEGVTLADGIRAENSAIPLLWISDDSALAVHSYPIRASGFLCQPVSGEEIAAALQRCAEQEEEETE